MFNTESEGLATAPMPDPITLDLNFLPERYRGRRLRLSTLRPWLFLLSFGLMLIPSVRVMSANLGGLAAVQSAFAAVSGELEAYQPLAEERSALEARIAAAQAESQAIEVAYQTINIHRVTWSELLPRILRAVPDGLVLTLVSHSEEQVILEGLAAEYALPSAFADRLGLLPDFAAVTIQSVERLLPEEQPLSEPTGETQAPDELPFLYRFEITLQFPVIETLKAAPEAQE
jgi:Tfp pilus assembly protein PilN